ncbi:UDP-glucuronic acid decarboxylase family protein [Maritalea porphyrae]|nr:UDP-glucuronic acid decarboxylase family protein [Maritalea porphyrae]MCZ4271837.1 SDR family oxidoreductase [Maritalea porphyrae]
MAQKTVLVTGGAGFLGSLLCERLLERGCRVLCVDNFLTGARQNVAHLLPNRNFELMKHDICLPLSAQVDEIFNLACPASPVHYQDDPIRTMKTNVLGALNMLGLAKRVNAKILQASTSEIYGDPLVHPQTEDYWGHVNPIGLRACYDEGKRCAETLFYDFQRQHGLNIRVARIFNTYGPYMHPEDGRVVSNFITQALKKQDITIYGNGQQTRSFCYRDDLVEGLLRLMDAPDFVCMPINMGNPNEFTIQELAQLVIGATKSSSKLINLPLPTDDPKKRQPDIGLAIKYLDWSPKVQLKEGLGNTIAYFRDILTNEAAV